MRLGDTNFIKKKESYFYCWV